MQVQVNITNIYDYIGPRRDSGSCRVQTRVWIPDGSLCFLYFSGSFRQIAFFFSLQKADRFQARDSPQEQLYTFVAVVSGWVGGK